MDQCQLRGDRIFCNGVGQLVESEVEDGGGNEDDAAEGYKVDSDGDVGVGILAATEKCS